MGLIALIVSLLVSAKPVPKPAVPTRAADTAKPAAPKPAAPAPAPASSVKPLDSLKAKPVPAKAGGLHRIPQVAVLSFAGPDLDEKTISAVTSRFETDLLATDSFKIVERRNIDRILREQGFQQSGACDNSQCSVEIGQVLSVDGIFTGELSRVGKTWSLSVKRTNVGTGQTEFSHVLDISGSLEDVLRGGCAEMAAIASGRKKPGKDHTVLVAKGSAPIWPWIAGGVVVAGGAVATAILLSQDNSSSSAPASEPDQMIVRW